MEKSSRLILLFRRISLNLVRTSPLKSRACSSCPRFGFQTRANPANPPGAACVPPTRRLNVVVGVEHRHPLLRAAPVLDETQRVGTTLRYRSLALWPLSMLAVARRPTDAIEALAVAVEHRAWCRPALQAAVVVARPAGGCRCRASCGPSARLSRRDTQPTKSGTVDRPLDPRADFGLDAAGVDRAGDARPSGREAHSARNGAGS